jgi:carbamoyl-phosphate synthase large subunit
MNLRALEGKRAFVSGGNGVIGKPLVRLLHESGARVLVGDLKPRPKNCPPEVQYRQGDLNFVRADELADFRPELFFHLAATFERSTETYGFWDENYQHNLRLSHHLLDCLKDQPSLERVIFASSYLIYDPSLYTAGAAADRPRSLNEGDRILPRNLCGAAKLNHEIELRFVEEFNHTRLNVVSARIYRSYGRHSRDIVSRWIRALLKGETLQVFRKEGVFDYVFADDVAEGLVRLALSDARGVVNLGSGQARRVSDVLEILRRHFPDLKSVDVPSDIPYEASQADMERFQSFTGWRPSTRLEDAIPLMIENEKREPYREEEDGAVSFGTLVTSVSRKVPLLEAVRAAQRKLGNSGELWGGDLDASAIGKNFVDRFWHMPRLSALGAPALIEFCKQHGIRCIVPTRDGELAYFAEHAPALAAEGISVMIAGPRAVELCLDKLAFATFLRAKGFPAIETHESAAALDARSFVVKERFGAGAKHMALGVSRAEAERHAATLDTPIFQPLISGQELSVDLYVERSGAVRGAIARRREQVLGGESQVTATCRDERLTALCADMARALDLRGHAIFQVLVDESGGYHVIECNARFGGASSLSVAAGLDSFYWFMLEASGVPLGDYPFLRSGADKRQIRYPADKVVDLPGS